MVRAADPGVRVMIVIVGEAAVLAVTRPMIALLLSFGAGAVRHHRHQIGGVLRAAATVGADSAAVATLAAVARVEIGNSIANWGKD